MPKRKMTVEEAFAVFEREGIEVKVVGLKEAPKSNLADFLEPQVSHDSQLDYSTYPPSRRKPVEKRKTVKAFLYTQHSVGSAGHVVDAGLATQRVEGAEYRIYGPGECEILLEDAQEVLHQDEQARIAYERFRSREPRDYIVEQVYRTNGSTARRAVRVGDIGAALGSDRFNSLGGV